jgi:hypothetical protein
MRLLPIGQFNTPFIPLSDKNRPFREFWRNSMDLYERIEHGGLHDVKMECEYTTWLWNMKSTQSSHNNRVFPKRLGPVTIGILLLVLLGHKASLEAQQLRSLRVELAAEESRYTLHAPVYAVVSVQNGLSEAIEFSFGRNSKSSLEFLLTPPDGLVALDVRYPRDPDGGLALVGTESLAPGETYKQRVLLNEWYDFSTPGAYTVQLKTDASFGTANGGIAQPLPIEKIVVRIGPRDDGQLGRVCRDLLALALADRPVQERVDAADALSRVQDPVAIPYLKEIIEKGFSSIQPYGFQGLGRIGNAEATEILIANLSIRDRELQRMVVRELTKLERFTVDQQMKARIRASLDRSGIK